MRAAAESAAAAGGWADGGFAHVPSRAVNAPGSFQLPEVVGAGPESPGVGLPAASVFAASSRASESARVGQAATVRRASGVNRAGIGVASMIG